MVGTLCPAVIGRSVELSVLAGALDSAARGAGSAILVTGEAGVGKSRLLREVRRWCAEQGGVALVGRAVDTAVAAPFRPLAEALLAAYRIDEVRDEVDVAPFRAALGCLVPDGAGGQVGPADVSLLHVAEGFLRVVRGIARRHGRAAVLLDDLHWADDETLAVLEYIADNIATEPVSLVLGARPALDTDAGRRLVALADRRVATHLRLTRLSPQQTLEMARACLGDTAVPAQVLELVGGRADGLPFFVEELLAGLVSDGSLRQEGGRWVAQVSGRARAPVSFAGSVGRRFASLTAETRDVLLDAALLGRRIDARLLADLRGVGAAGIEDALEAAENVALLESDDLGTRFRHALTRDALLAQVSPRLRAARARRALEVLRSTRLDLDAVLGEVAADLAEVAGDGPAAAEALLEVGRRAIAKGALTSAESALRRAATHTGDGPIGLAVDEALVETLALAGRVEEVFLLGETLLARLTDAAITADPDGRRRGDVHLALARAAVAATDWPLAASHLEQVTAFGGLDLTRTAQADTMHAVVALGDGRLRDAESLAATAVDSAERAGSADLLCEALLVHGRCARNSDFPAAERRFDRARSVARDAGLGHREARVLAELGVIDGWRNGGTARLVEARDRAAGCGAPETEAVAENALGTAAWLRGDGEAMRGHAAAQLALSRRFRLGLMVPSALSLLAAAEALRGDATAMEAVLAESAPLIKDQPTQLIARHAHCRAVCALVHDDLVTARAEFAEAVAIVRSRRVVTIPPFTVMHVLLETVHDADPATLLSELAQLDRSDVPIMAALLRAADAVRLGRVGDGPAAVAGMEQSLRDLRLNPFVQAVAIRLVAPRAAAAGWGRPVDWLGSALATFDARHMSAPAAACRAALRELGVRSDPAGGTGDEMSAREREVLDLVAEGLANRAIAERLFLSPRTVEKHVERLLAKTGSVNRAQLATYALRRAIT